jgi:hypothetical protein
MWLVTGMAEAGDPLNPAGAKIIAAEAAQWEISRPFEEMVRREAGRLQYTAKVHVANRTGRLYPIQLVPSLTQDGSTAAGAAINDILDAGQSREYSLSVPMPGRNAGELTVVIHDRRRPERLYFTRTFAVTAAYVPIELVIRDPPYRNTIYATEKIEAIRADVTLALTPEEIAALRAVVSLLWWSTEF